MIGVSSDVMVIENYVDAQCRRHLHLMSNYFVDRPSASAEGGVLKNESGVWHYRAVYPYRGILDVACVENDKKFRRLVVWSLTPPPTPPQMRKSTEFGEGRWTVRQAISEAESYFWSMFRFRPGFVFMRRLPNGVDIGQDVDGMILFDADWMLDRCVAVGGR